MLSRKIKNFFTHNLTPDQISKINFEEALKLGNTPAGFIAFKNLLENGTGAYAALSAYVIADNLSMRAIRSKFNSIEEEIIFLQKTFEVDQNCIIKAKEKHPLVGAYVAAQIYLDVLDSRMKGLFEKHETDDMKKQIYVNKYLCEGLINQSKYTQDYNSLNTFIMKRYQQDISKFDNHVANELVQEKFKMSEKEVDGYFKIIREATGQIKNCMDVLNFNMGFIDTDNQIISAAREIVDAKLITNISNSYK